MISIITSISDRAGFENLKRSLINLEPDWSLGVDIICLVRDEKLYVESRNFLRENVDRGECLVLFNETDEPFKEGVNIVTDKNPYVYLASEKVLIPRGGVTKLYRDYLEKPKAGLISGRFVEYPTVYWVKDVYGELPHYIYSNERDIGLGLLMGIDTCTASGLMTKTDLYRELFGFSDLDGYGGYSFGIRLRRQGYKNYLDTGVELKFGGN